MKIFLQLKWNNLKLLIKKKITFIYINFFYLKCLKYREDLCKENAKETIEKCYETIYRDVISKVSNIEDLMLSENRISFLCNVLNTNREQIILSMLNKLIYILLRIKNNLTTNESSKVIFV